MEDGQLTDTHGRKADLRNCVLILTSNVGARQITSRGRLGFSSQQAQAGLRPLDEVKAAVLEDARRTFRPEFLNRLDEIVVFRQLGKPELSDIACRMLQRLSSRLEKLGVQLTVTEEAHNLLTQEGFDPDYGARPLRRVLRTQIEDPAAELLLSESLPSGSTLTIAASAGKITLLPASLALPTE